MIYGVYLVLLSTLCYKHHIYHHPFELFPTHRAHLGFKCRTSKRVFVCKQDLRHHTDW